MAVGRAQNEAPVAPSAPVPIGVAASPAVGASSAVQQALALQQPTGPILQGPAGTGAAGAPHGEHELNESSCGAAAEACDHDGGGGGDDEEKHHQAVLHRDKEARRAEAAEDAVGAYACVASLNLRFNTDNPTRVRQSFRFPLQLQRTQEHEAMDTTNHNRRAACLLVRCRMCDA